MHLTPREKQVWNLIAKGVKQETIATELGIHVRTVEFHLANVRAKTNSGSNIQAILSLALKPVGNHSLGNPQLTLFD